MCVRNCTSMIHVRARGTICALHNHYWKAHFALFIFDNFSINTCRSFNCCNEGKFDDCSAYCGMCHWANKTECTSFQILGSAGFLQFSNAPKPRERGGDKICKVEHQSILLPSMQRKNGIERLSRCPAVASPAAVCRPDGRCMGALAQTKVERVRGNS